MKRAGGQCSCHGGCGRLGCNEGIGTLVCVGEEQIGLFWRWRGEVAKVV